MVDLVRTTPNPDFLELREILLAHPGARVVFVSPGRHEILLNRQELETRRPSYELEVLGVRFQAVPNWPHNVLGVV